MTRALALVLLLGACAPQLTPPMSEVPDLRGMWHGTWGGSPLALLVIEQEGTVTPGGILVGPYSLFGQRLPALSGVLTFNTRGVPVTVNVRGHFGDVGGRLTLVVDGLSPNNQQLVLKHTEADRLKGTGTSRPSWEPQGEVDLVRVTTGRERD
jgi:hypothetical protein